MHSVKEQLHQWCCDKLNERIAFAKDSIDRAQEAANAEEKSSAGDKYETGRAMAQNTRDQAARQLDELLKLKAVLDRIDPSSTASNVALGSIVITDKNNFYVAVSLGIAEVNGIAYFVISPQSPIGSLLMKAHKGDTITFNQQKQTILEIL